MASFGDERSGIMMTCCFPILLPSGVEAGRNTCTLAEEASKMVSGSI